VTPLTQRVRQTTGRTHAVLVLVAAWVVSTVVMAEPVTFTKDTPLRAEPHFDSSSVTRVPKGSEGEAGTKKGPWLNITTQLGTGWALTTDISYGLPSAASGGGVMSTVSGLLGRRQPAKTTSTIGIRGFDEATIAKALDGGSVNLSQLARLDGLTVNAAAGGTHASAKGLVATSLSY
jgi:hypothetical protein